MRRLSIVLALSVIGQADEKPLRVCATTPDLGSLVREVGGPHVQVKSFCRGAEDPHWVEARPSHVRALNRADLLVKVGLDLEVGWLPVLVANARNRVVLEGRPGHLDASGAVEVKEVPAGPIDRSMGDVHAFGNPHYLLDPRNGKKVAALLRDRLTRLRPSAKADFHERYTRFAKRVDAGSARWSKRLAPFRGVEVITDHKSWTYFLDRFGLKSAGTLEPKPGVRPTTRHLTGLIRRARERKVRAVVTVPYFDRRYGKFVADKTGAQLVVLAHQTGALPGTNGYLAMLDRNVELLAEALAR